MMTRWLLPANVLEKRYDWALIRTLPPFRSDGCLKNSVS
jgi:hypothetical protein